MFGVRVRGLAPARAPVIVAGAAILSEVLDRYGRFLWGGAALLLMLVLLAARIACLAKATSELWLPEFTRVVFQANFAEDREIGDPAEIRSILNSLGQSGAQLIEQAQAPENKLRLREQTRRAKELGIFGAPSFVVGAELFWGNDRLEDALAWAGSRTGEARR
jgi:predicted DsbA family dithiol-disulfide isomerase